MWNICFSKNITRRILSALTLVCCLFSLAVSAAVSASAHPHPVAARGGMSWYCAHVKGHVQPSADTCFDFLSTCDGYYIDHRHSEPDATDKVVYLTFDVGYENGNVARVLDALQSEGATGAFFVLGHVAEGNPELIRRMHEEGHLVCNHTFSHKVLVDEPGEVLSADLERLEKACLESAEVTVAKYFRPPEGRFDRAMLETVQGLGYKTVFWSFAYPDWDNRRQPDPDWAKNKILENMHNGAVLLLHPTSATNAEILGDVLRTLRCEGYRFGSLDELTADGNVGGDVHVE